VVEVLSAFKQNDFIFCCVKLPDLNELCLDDECIELEIIPSIIFKWNVAIARTSPEMEGEY
jgi:hypothetical protein